MVSSRFWVVSGDIRWFLVLVSTDKYGFFQKKMNNSKRLLLLICKQKYTEKNGRF